MGVVHIEGKPVTLDDQIIDAGIDAVNAALSVDFPDVENADISIEKPKTIGAPATASVVKRGTGKGQELSLAQREVLARLGAAPEHLNPAIMLALDVMRAEASGDAKFLEQAIRSGELERAVEMGERGGMAVQKALAACAHGIAVPSNKVPAGF
jgi:hypothetical protein